MDPNHRGTVRARRSAASARVPHGHGPIWRLIAGLAVSVLLAACSIQRYAIRSVGDALASSGSVFEADDDPVLIGEALPFSLKLIESLLAAEPEHRGLLLAAARGYLLYSYAYVDRPADELRFEEFSRTRELRARARKLYLRAHGYGSRALALDYPGLPEELVADPAAAMLRVGQRPARDVATLYWTAAALGLAISVSRNDAALLARLPEVEAMLGRALELEPAWNDGALHEFAMSLASAGVTELDASDVETHYREALSLSEGARAGVYVSYVEAVAIPHQDREQFISLLQQALEVDVDRKPEQRLLNVIAQERAQWLLEHIDEFIL